MSTIEFLCIGSKNIIHGSKKIDFNDKVKNYYEDGEIKKTIDNTLTNLVPKISLRKKDTYYVIHMFLGTNSLNDIKINSSTENIYINEYGVKKYGKLTYMIPSEHKDQYITISIGNTANEYDLDAIDNYPFIEQNYGILFEDSLDFDYDFNDLTGIHIK